MIVNADNGDNIHPMIYILIIIDFKVDRLEYFATHCQFPIKIKLFVFTIANNIHSSYSIYKFVLVLGTDFVVLVAIRVLSPPDPHQLSSKIHSILTGI